MDRKYERQAAKKYSTFNRILLLYKKLIAFDVNHKNVKHNFNDILLSVAGRLVSGEIFAFTFYGG